MRRRLALPPVRVTRLFTRRGARVLAGGVGLAVAGVAIGVAVEVSPMRTVPVAGQVVAVGAVPRLGLSGPGEVDLFGQDLPTAISFPGPVRPRLALTQITLDSELANFVQGSSPSAATRVLGSRLAAGWFGYFGWEAGIAALVALILAGAVAGWRRLARRATARLPAVALVVTQLINLGAVVVTAYGARHALRQVSSLNQLVGSKPVGPVRARKTAGVIPGVRAIVLGDSTAAGAGLPLVADPSKVDRACGRSSSAYAEDLDAANGWKAMNLACDSATVRQCLLGSQQEGGQAIPAQITAARKVQGASVIIVSVGADDLQWSATVEICAVAPRCDNRASAAYFQQKLAAFSTDYLQLLTQLSWALCPASPGHNQPLLRSLRRGRPVHHRERGHRGQGSHAQLVARGPEQDPG